MAAIQAEHPEVAVEEAVSIAADQAEEILESEQVEQESAHGPRELPLVGGALVPNRHTPGAAANDMAS